MEQNKTSTMGGNPDIKFPPKTGVAMPYAKDGKITEWANAPSSGNYMVTIVNGKFEFIPLPSGKWIFTVRNGSMEFASVPDGSLQLLNNSLEWTSTENCS